MPQPTSKRNAAERAPDVNLTRRADAECVPAIRHTLEAAAAAAGLHGELLQRMRLAVSEACTNVVLHAYDEHGLVSVDASFSDVGVQVVVLGRRRWGVRATTATRLPGFRLPLIAALCDQASSSRATKPPLRAAHVLPLAGTSVVTQSRPDKPRPTAQLLLDGCDSFLARVEDPEPGEREPVVPSDPCEVDQHARWTCRSQSTATWLPAARRAGPPTRKSPSNAATAQSTTMRRQPQRRPSRVKNRCTRRRARSPARGEQPPEPRAGTDDDAGSSTRRRLPQPPRRGPRPARGRPSRSSRCDAGRA